MVVPIRLRIGLAAALAAGLFAACGTGSTALPPTADAAWTQARAKFLDKDYFDAEQELDVMRLQFAGSAHSDSVQFLLGDCDFNQDKFVLAAYEYGTVRRSYPTSPLVRYAAFKVAESYFMLSPPSGIDQEYTHKAIDAFQEFLELYGRGAYAGDSLSLAALAHIKDLRGRLGKKVYDTAVLYFKMDQYRACAVYCDLVQDQYYDTDYADRAGELKIRCLIEQHRYNEAGREIEKFLATYRASLLVPEVRELRDGIAKKITSPQ